MTNLEAEIRRRVAAAGPMPVGEFMALCLGDPAHGYYMTRDPLGARGDFVTAPEVSQMFGELIGLWMAALWTQMGSPENVRLIELGPGRGTLMRDALRAVKVLPDFRNAVVLHLVEISPVLRAAQEHTLAGENAPMHWHASLNEVPPGPAIIVANEFFDALPVNQAVRTATGWHERCIGVDANGHLAFVPAAEVIPHFDLALPMRLREAPESSVFEWRADTAAMELGRRVAREGGGALVIDYGHTESALGETLQAVGRHAYADVLAEPGNVDLTAHVDFEALIRAGEAMGAKAYGPIEQSAFLRRLGIETRAAKLKAKATREASLDVDAALKRLIGQGRGNMGALFKVVAFTHPSLPAPPAFGS